MKKLIILLFMIININCDRGQLDGKIVKDAEGNLYEVKHSIDKLYFLNNISEKQLQEIEKLK